MSNRRVAQRDCAHECHKFARRTYRKVVPVPGALEVDLGGLRGIEIKLTFPAERIEHACSVFGFEANSGAPRRIWFGEVLNGRDGPTALPLSERGVVLRVRDRKKGGDVTVKLRAPDGCVDVPAWNRGPGAHLDAKIEGDWAGRRLVSASLSRDLDEDAMAELESARPCVSSLLSEPQRDLAGQLLLPFDHVELLGPIQARKWDARQGDDVEGELWEIDTLRFLEVSIFVEEDPVGAMERLRRRARNGDLPIDRGQETKTATVLRHLATRHAARQQPE